MNRMIEGEIFRPGEVDTKVESNEKKVRARFWQTLRKAANNIPFMEDLVAAYYCALDPSTPFRVRATLLGALAYFVLPLDWVPDFIIGFGFTDDIAVLTAAIAAIRSNIRDIHYDAARSVLGGKWPDRDG